METFNWGFDYFDVIAAGNTQPALIVVEEDGTNHVRTFQELSEGSNRVASFFRTLGMKRGDRLLVMLGNEVALWETFVACMKLGVVVIPATTLLGADDIRDRFDRGRRLCIEVRGDLATLHPNQRRRPHAGRMARVRRVGGGDHLAESRSGNRSR
jgi:acyl-coenzyme A synthetase/AMP-(fatty) acid ligase